MKPINIGGHSAYQDRVLYQLRKYYPDAAISLSSTLWLILEKFWDLDLSAIDVMMQDRYSAFGPRPRLPSDMFRALLVSVQFKISSYTRLASDLKKNHLHAIISDFPVGDTPGTGTFYDFHKRLWLSDNKNLSDPIHAPKDKPEKPIGKEEKAAPVGKVTVEDLFRQFQESPPSDMAPCAMLWEIFDNFFLQASVNNGLISLKELSLAGDGTPIYTAAQERKTRICDCLDQGMRTCRCNRIYHQPDCDIGWDSHRKRYYFGYHLYMLTAADSKNSLPVFPLLSPASRHDSHGFLYNWFSMKKINPPRDSAEWKLEYNARTSAERCNKREKIDYKLKDGRYRSSKMWYCRLFAIMMCQHLDAWTLPKTSRLKDLFEQAA